MLKTMELFVIVHPKYYTPRAKRFLPYLLPGKEALFCLNIEYRTY